MFCAGSIIASAIPLGASAASDTKKYEAESANFTGDISRVNDSSRSGNQYLDILQSGTCTFSVDIPEDGYYDLHFRSFGNEGEKWNYAEIDGVYIGNFMTEKDTWMDAGLNCIYIKKGTRKISFVTDWGWTKLDYLEVTHEPFDPEKVYKAEPTLSNPNASESAKKLMKFICDNYGKNVISGQQVAGDEKNVLDNKELVAIKKATGKLPAILGIEMMDYMPARITLGGSQGPYKYSVDNALEYAKQGGIIAVTWHWSAPAKNIKSGIDEETGNPAWWGGFQSWNVVNFDLSDILDNPNGETYKLLMKDIEVIATEMKRLQDADVPVLFRPLHEASGTWFWWGADGPEPYKRLYKLLYDKLTNEYKLNNLIWVWNGQAKDWYPGDEYVDIIAEDIYLDPHDYGVSSAKFVEASNYTTANKVVTRAETGSLFDIDEAIKAKTLWSWFVTWNYSFVADDNKELNGIYTEKSMWKKVYSHKNVLTLDDVKKALRTDDKDKQTTAQKTEEKKLSAAKVTIPKKTYTYTGKAIKPTPTVKLDGKKLVKGTDYTVSYKNNKKTGKAYVIIKGKGSYTGTVKVAFTIKKKTTKT